MFSLCQKVRGDVFCRRCLIGDDQDFRRPRREVNCGTGGIRAHEGLGAGYPGITGAEYLGNFWHGLRTVSHGGDSLRAANLVHLSHAGPGCSYQHRRISASVRPRRRSEDSNRTTCKIGGHGKHDGS